VTTPAPTPTPVPSEIPKTSPPLSVRINSLKIQISNLKFAIQKEIDPNSVDAWKSELARLESELADYERQKAELEAQQ